MESKMKVLMVAEKASIARSIAEALAGKGKYVPRQGKAKFCPIMNWDGEFMGKKAEFHCTSVAGHIFNRDLPEKFQDWKIDPIELFAAPTIKKVANPDQFIVEHLEQESQKVDYIVLWLDCDREGENICYEVLEVCEKNLTKGTGQRIYRAKFSSVTAEDIQSAYKGLKNGPNKNESMAVEARQIIDLKVGFAFTRLQTKHLRKYEELQQNVLSYGPCQTPTLAFCVDRAQVIKNFKAQPVQLIQSVIELPDKKTIMIESRSNPNPNAAKDTDAKFVEVTTYSNKDEVVSSPTPLNTISLLKFASKELSFSPSETMHMAEHLYLQGVLTYPRTETTKYSSTFDHLTPLKALELGKFAALATGLLKAGPIKTSVGEDKGDHPPITPTSKTPQAFDSVQEEKLYEFVVRYFMATLGGPTTYQNTDLKLKLGKQVFDYQGVRILVPGFIQYAPFLARQERLLPVLKVGQKLPALSVKVTDEQTQPPSFLPEIELIELMDKNHIGTDASLASHINTICERKYVMVDPKTRCLQTTKLGEAFILGYKEVDQDLCSPKLRSDMEKNLDQIALGKKDYEKVLQQVLDQFKEKYIKFEKNISLMQKYFDGVFTSGDEAMKTAPPFSICGRCKNQMKLSQGKLFCEKCKCMYGLPKKVDYKRTNKFCEKDQFEFIMCEPLGGKGQATQLCPQCNQKAWKEQQLQQK